MLAALILLLSIGIETQAHLCQPTGPTCTNATMDAVILLDSSLSAGRGHWVTLTRFIRSIIASFSISDDTGRFAVIRYSSAVDKANQIKLKDYSNNKTGFLNAFDRLPYDGSGTKTGQAITHAAKVLMTPENGDRPNVTNVLIVVTDGNSRDNASAPAQALRRRGVITFAVGIVPARGMLDRTKLVELAGDETRVLNAEGFGSLDADFERSIKASVCGSLCKI